MDDLLELLEHQPNNINARMELVKRYIDKEDYENASNMLEEIIKLDQGHLEGNYVLVQLCEFREDFEKQPII